MQTDDLITHLAADLRPVRRLGSPLRRALATLAVAFALGLLAVVLSDLSAFVSRHSGREVRMAAEMGAALATGVVAVIGAFFLAVPGGSKLWLAAPLPPLAIWFLMSAAGCAPDAATGWSIGHSWHCLAFLAGTSLVVGVPLAWRLSRARPVHPVRVALLAGLGSAALSVFLLNFFHPFAVTAIDLAAHVAAMLLVTGAAVALRRGLNPA